MASIHVLGQTSGGRCAFATFLVDTWCVGLKDVFGRREITRGEFEDILDQASATMDVARIDAATARRLVAGGIRFARRNGFRLPNHHDRWTAIFGDIGDVNAADLSGFGVDGNVAQLRYVGTAEFLRNRLVGCTVEQFLSRPDVQWVMADGAPRHNDPALDDWSDSYGLLGNEDEEDDYDGEDGEDDDDSNDVLAERTPEEREVVKAIADQVRDAADRIQPALLKWCADTGRAPHPRVREGLDLLLMSMMPVAMYSQMARETPDVVAGYRPPNPDDFTDDALERLSPAERPQVEAALDQVTDFMGSRKNPLDMLASLVPAGGDRPPPLPGQFA